MKRGGIALAIVGCALVAAVPAGATTPSRPSAATVAGLRAKLLTFAKANGDAHPTRLYGVLTTEHRVERGRGGADFPVYLLQEVGHFRLGSVPRPPGSPAPTGSVIELTVGVADGRIYDLGVSGRTLVLGHFGPTVFPLD